MFSVLTLDCACHKIHDCVLQLFPCYSLSPSVVLFTSEMREDTLELAVLGELLVRLNMPPINEGSSYSSADSDPLGQGGTQDYVSSLASDGGDVSGLWSPP